MQFELWQLRRSELSGMSSDLQKLFPEIDHLLGQSKSIRITVTSEHSACDLDIELSRAERSVTVCLQSRQDGMRSISCKAANIVGLELALLRLIQQADYTRHAWGIRFLALPLARHFKVWFPLDTQVDLDARIQLQRQHTERPSPALADSIRQVDERLQQHLHSASQRMDRQATSAKR